MKSAVLLFAGALLFGSAAGADDGHRVPPPPPAPPAAPMPPKPPKPPKAGAFGSGFGVSIHDGKVTIDGLDDMVDGQINAALAQVASDPNIPPKVREKVIKHLEKIRSKVKARLSHLDAKDLDELGDELGKLGDDIGDEMDGLGSDMEQMGKDMDQWGKQFGKNMGQWGKQFGKNMGQWGQQFGKNWKMQHGPQVMVMGDDDDDDDADMPDPDDIDDDVVRGLGDLSLSQPQREQLKRLRIESDAKVAQAKHDLERASEMLEKQLQNPNASDADISRSIDTVAQQEAAIRKARILAWVNARRMLDDGQRKKVESAAKHR
jgi:superfamily II RNA helicase